MWCFVCDRWHVFVSYNLYGFAYLSIGPARTKFRILQYTVLIILNLVRVLNLVASLLNVQCVGTYWSQLPTSPCLPCTLLPHTGEP